MEKFNFRWFCASLFCMAIKTDDSILQQMLTDPARRDEGFRMLMKQYGPALYWHIRRIVIGHDDAEDVLQETCIKVLNHIGSFMGDGTLATWLYRVATNESLQHLRRQTRLFQSIDTLGETLTSKLQAESELDSTAVETMFQQALLTLPTQQRIAFNLRYYDGLSYEEIAHITGKNIATLKTNYHYASQRVKQYIKEHSR